MKTTRQGENIIRNQIKFSIFRVLSDFIQGQKWINALLLTLKVHDE